MHITEIRKELEDILQMQGAFYCVAIAPESIRDCFSFPKANNEISTKLLELINQVDDLI